MDGLDGTLIFFRMQRVSNVLIATYYIGQHYNDYIFYIRLNMVLYCSAVHQIHVAIPLHFMCNGIDHKIGKQFIYRDHLRSLYDRDLHNAALICRFLVVL